MRLSMLLGWSALWVALGARAEQAPASQQSSGVVVEIGVGETLLVGGGGSSSLAVVGLPFGRLFVGGKTGRAVFGVGFELLRLGSGSSGSGGFSSSSSQTLLAGTLNGRFVLAQSQDEKVELLAALSLGAGHVFYESSSSASTAPGNTRLIWEVGPALRYWVHPQLAVGALAAVRGDHFSADSSSGGVGSSSSSLISLFTSLNLLGVF